MAKKNSSSSSETGAPKTDASYMEPRLIPDSQLIGRDDSGGLDYQPYAGQFSDRGFVQGGARKRLRGGGEDPIAGDEQDSTAAARNRNKGDRGPASSRARAVSTK